MCNLKPCPPSTRFRFKTQFFFADWPFDLVALGFEIRAFSVSSFYSLLIAAAFSGEDFCATKYP